MAYDGNGNFIRLFSWVTDKNNGVPITSSRVDSEDNGFAAGLTLAVTRDGQGKMAANFLPSVANSYALGSVSFPWTQVITQAFQATQTQIQGWSPTATVLLDMTPDKGTWTSTLSGPWTAGNNITGTLNWERQGTQVTIWCDANILQTATLAATLVASGMPNSIIPTSTREIYVTQLQDNGSSGWCGTARVLTNGTIQFNLLSITGSKIQRGQTFTGSGSTGLGASLSFSYSL